MTKDPVYFSCRFGQETFQKKAAHHYIFWCPQKNLFPEDIGAKEIALASAVRYGNGGLKELSRTVTDPFIGTSGGVSLGSWTDGKYAAPEGTILKLHGQTLDWGSAKKANLYIRLRNGAALREIRLPLTQTTRSRYQHAFFSGAFDLLSTEDVDLAGIKIIPAFLPLSAPYNIKRTFNEIILSPATAEKPIVAPPIKMQWNPAHNEVPPNVAKSTPTALDVTPQGVATPSEDLPPDIVTPHTQTCIIPRAKRKIMRGK